MTQEGWALYGVKRTPSSISVFVEEVVRLAVSRGHLVERIAMTGGGYTGKWRNGPRTLRRLRESGYAGADGAELIAYGEEDGQERIRAVIFRRGDAACCFITDAEPPNEVCLVSLRILAGAFAAQYGMVLEGNLASPLYVAGIGREGESNEWVDQLMFWARAGMIGGAYRLGFLRDVYRVNLLNGAQLRMPCGAGTLEEWIRSSAERGSLQPFTDKLTRWDLGADARPKIRQVLWDEGLILRRDLHKHLLREVYDE